MYVGTNCFFFKCFFIFHLFLSEALLPSGIVNLKSSILCGPGRSFTVGPTTKWWLLHFVCPPCIVAKPSCLTMLVQSRDTYKNKFKNSLRTYWTHDAQAQTQVYTLDPWSEKRLTSYRTQPCKNMSSSDFLFYDLSRISKTDPLVWEAINFLPYIIYPYVNIFYTKFYTVGSEIRVPNTWKLTVYTYIRKLTVDKPVNFWNKVLS